MNLDLSLYPCSRFATVQKSGDFFLQELQVRYCNCTKDARLWLGYM